jgi:hypothetical protein
MAVHSWHVYLMLVGFSRSVCQRVADVNWTVVLSFFPLFGVTVAMVYRANIIHACSAELRNKKAHLFVSCFAYFAEGARVCFLNRESAVTVDM